MAVYKVPQDVEAEDKLLGPFSFRQFIYLLIAGVGGLVMWLLWAISPFLAVIPFPITAFFLILALPLRKDQPMEIYLLAVIQFFLKPKRRLWAPDGTMSLVQITAPKTVEVSRSKDLSENEAMNRLSYLAQIMDTRGWAARGISEVNNSAVSEAVAREAQQTEDVLDKQATVAQSFDALIEQKDADRRQKAIDTMRQTTADNPTPRPVAATSTAMPTIPGNPYDQYMRQAPAVDDEVTPEPTPSAVQQPEATTTPRAPEPVSTSSSVQFNPYPSAIHQQVITPDTDVAKAAAQSAPPTPEPTPKAEKSSGANEVSPDIINLANNTDFTISTIAHEAQRIQQKQQEDTEVIIPLR